MFTQFEQMCSLLALMGVPFELEERTIEGQYRLQVIVLNVEPWGKQALLPPTVVVEGVTVNRAIENFSDSTGQDWHFTEAGMLTEIVIRA